MKRLKLGLVVPSPGLGSGHPPAGIQRGALADPTSGQVWTVGFNNTERTLTELKP